VLHCRRIVDGGSSADAQLRVFAPDNPADGPGGLNAVLRWIAQDTVASVKPSAAEQWDSAAVGRS
jgi:hypothetical protein